MDKEQIIITVMAFIAGIMAKVSVDIDSKARKARTAALKAAKKQEAPVAKKVAKKAPAKKAVKKAAPKK
jgi:hypothetical protein